MQVEQNKAIAGQFYEEIINKGDIKKYFLNVFENAIAEGFEECPVLSNPSGEVTDYKYFPGWTSTVLPGMYVKVDDIMSEDDKVVACLTIKASYRAALIHNIASTEKQIICSSIDILSIVDGKIKEYWTQSDLPGLLKQMGIIPGSITTIKEPDYNLHPQY